MRLNRIKLEEMEKEDDIWENHQIYIQNDFKKRSYNLRHTKLPDNVSFLYASVINTGKLI